MFGAGLLLYNKASVLLGLHSEGWTTLSGKSTLHETPRQTATREFHEETCHAFDAQRVSAWVCHSREFVSTTPSGKRFHLFCVETPDVSLDGFAPGRNAEIKQRAWMRWGEVPRARLRAALARDLRAIKGFLEVE